MTESQQKALAAAFLLLEAEFDHVVVVTSDKERQGGLIIEDTNACWSGGLITAKHLATDAVAKMNYRKVTRCPPSVNAAVMRWVTQQMKRKLLNENKS